jgi:thioredoxin-dependent peroxiredoxin
VSATSATGSVKVGQTAPDFTLPNQDGVMVHLHDYLGQSAVVLYFYPKDNTSGCTAEACSFRDSYEVFRESGATVLGVSSDSVESHKTFAQRQHLSFMLLSDEKNAVRKLYNVPTTLGLIPGRVTYIIDRQGIIRHIFSSQLQATRHVEEALNIVKQLQADAS